MADNLPLIPGKGSVCADVKPVLREVFRELDYLPPLTIDQAAAQRSGAGRTLIKREAMVPNEGDRSPPVVDPWIETFTSECKEIWLREGELKQQHATRISREPLPNIFKLYPPDPDRKAVPQWKLQRGLIERRDLMPNIQENAGRDATLWIKNILNRSSCNVTTVEEGSHVYTAVRIRTPEELTVQTLSIGEVFTLPPLPPLPEPPTPYMPEYILCVPPNLDFVNFVVGELHSQNLRLVNVSKFEIRLAIRPPKRREFNVELCGQRGLTVTSGSAAELRIHFRPRDVRTLRDLLYVRVSMGKSAVVPISCYMQPPIVDLLVPNVTSSAFWCTPDELCGSAPSRGCDVLELGSRLLGDVHCVRLLFNCNAEHAAFFLLTEDAWLSYCIDCVTSHGTVIAGPFTVWPAWWAGGGAVRAIAWCQAPSVGLHTMPVRLLSSTAVVRHLHILADSLHWRPDHLTVEAQDKDYDICSDDDPACEYYVHLGTTFPHRSLSATVQLLNHSPVVYSYYWSIRPWGVCSCWEEERDGSNASPVSPEEADDKYCIGFLANRASGSKAKDIAGENAHLVRVEPARGQVSPRSSCALHVRVPDVGARLGTQRAVLMLVLKNIPKESFPPDYSPMIVSTEELEAELIPGVQACSREVCEVVSAQMEVWWEVAPVRFVLDPPILPVFYSRRLHSVELQLSSTQLYGCDSIPVTWKTPEHIGTPPQARLTPAQSAATTLTVQLPSQPDERPAIDVVTLLASNQEWSSPCKILRMCATRYPALRPARTWLGIVPPGTHMHKTLDIFNDTHQYIRWWGQPYRWWGERSPRPACEGRLPCPRCQERACTCAMMRPTRGAIEHMHAQDICYNVNAPDCDGCVATLIQVRRTGADVAQVHDAPGTEARAALIAYRVLAPRLLLRTFPCFGDKKSHCEGCSLDTGMADSKLGTVCLRPLGALALNRRSCYRLRVTNLTPLATVVHWENHPEGDDVLKVKFIPSHFEVRSYGEVEIRVVLEARKVCGRRIYVHCAQVANAYRPLYLIIDAAITGVEVTCEIPLGDGDKTGSFIIVRRSQKEEYPWEARKPKPSTAGEWFADDDFKRTVVNENICHCPFELVYIAPVPPVKRPDSNDSPVIEIVTEPPSLTRICSCVNCSKPIVPENVEPICLQFRNVPTRTVRTRTIVLRNESVLTAHWSTTIRRWPRIHTRTLAVDQWEGDVRAPGLVVQCAPSRGVLAGGASARIHVQVYADCWGLYFEQIMLQIINLEPIIVDVWVEAVGPPLQFALQPTDKILPTLWMSASDPERILRVKNVSRSDIIVHAYVLEKHEHPQHALPFRLYLRFFDVPPRTCPCLDAVDSDEFVNLSDAEASTNSEEMDTGVEVYLASDFGIQQDTNFKVNPEVTTIAAGECMEWNVKLNPPLHAEIATSVNLLLHLHPINSSGSYWSRPEPPPQFVKILQTPREGLLKVSGAELHVKLSALALPYRDVMRVRKRFRIQNVGNGPLEICAQTSAPWCVVVEDPEHSVCGLGCWCVDEADVAQPAREVAVPFNLEARSSVEVTVEVCIRTVDAWPENVETTDTCQPSRYDQWQITDTPLQFYDDDNLLLTVPLILELEYPIIRVEPLTIDFGFVTDGDTRKTYFTVSHTSSTLTLDMMLRWDGGNEFRLWPHCVAIPPGVSKRVYLQYTAVWQAAAAEGCARVRTCGASGAWCRAALPCRAWPARDHKCHATRHDHTDDTHLLPPPAPPALGVPE